MGVGKGTLYRHYASRENLFDAALGLSLAFAPRANQPT